MTNLQAKKGNVFAKILFRFYVKFLYSEGISILWRFEQHKQ